MTDKRGSITYSKVDDAYFAARGLRRHAGVGLRWGLGVAIWFGIGITYFAVWGRHKLILSPEEELAMAHHERVRVGSDA